MTPEILVLKESLSQRLTVNMMEMLKGGLDIPNERDIRAALERDEPELLLESIQKIINLTMTEGYGRCLQDTIQLIEAVEKTGAASG